MTVSANRFRSGQLSPAQRRRRLIVEHLEMRRLLTTAAATHTFREEAFSIAGSFTYELIDGTDYRDVISNGQYESTTGSIKWEGPRFGVGSFAGAATGDGNDFVRVAGSMRACSSYGIEDVGQLGFEVDAFDGSLLITENRLDRAVYTYYVDHLDGNCPAPDPPWSRFFGGQTNLYVGTFNAANSTASISYQESNPDIVIDAPPANVTWENNSPTELTLTAKAPPPKVEIPDGWVIVDQTTEPPEDIDFIHLGSGIDIEVAVTGRPLPVRGDVDQISANIRLYWQDTPTGLQKEEISVTVDGGGELGLYWNTQVFNASITDFPAPPSWANFVKIEVDTIDGEIVLDNSKLLAIENWEASNDVTPVQLTEDQVLNGLLGSIMALEDSLDPDVKLYAYDPESLLGASVTVSNDDGGFLYDPREAPEIQALREGEEVNDGMSFIAVKYQTIYSPASHVVLLVGANDLPIVTNEEGETFSDSTITFFPAINDIDIDRDDFVVLHSVPETSDRGATLTKSEDGSVVYDPTTSNELADLYVDEVLVDQFNYEVIDSFGGTATGTVTITVTGVRPFPSTTLVLPPTQFTVMNIPTSLIPLSVDHSAIDPSQLIVSARSLRPDVVADDQITIGGGGKDRTLQLTPTTDQVGRVPVQVTVTAPDGDSAEGVFQLFVGTESDQDLDGVSNEMEDAGINGGDSNGDGILDRLQANVVSLTTDVQGNRLNISVPDGTYLHDISLSTAPPASGVAGAAQLPLGLLHFSAELPASSDSVEMTVSTDFSVQPINSAYFYAEVANAGEWQHIMRNDQEGVRIYADRLEVKLLDDGATDLGTPADGYVTHALALASVENPWQNILPQDVNNSGSIQAIDALVIINDLNRKGVRDLPVRLTGDDQIPNFLDVSGDGKVTPIDALAVINWINRNPGGAEGESGDHFSSGSIINAGSAQRSDQLQNSDDDERWRLRLAVWDAMLNELF